MASCRSDNRAQFHPIRRSGGVPSLPSCDSVRPGLGLGHPNVDVHGPFDRIVVELGFVSKRNKRLGSAIAQGETGRTTHGWTPSQYTTDQAGTPTSTHAHTERKERPDIPITNQYSIPPHLTALSCGLSAESATSFHARWTGASHHTSTIALTFRPSYTPRTKSHTVSYLPVGYFVL